MEESILGLKAVLDNTVEKDRTNNTNDIYIQLQVDIRRLLEGVQSGFISPYHVKWLKFGFNVNIVYIYDSKKPCFRIYSGKTDEYIDITKPERYEETLMYVLEILDADGFKIEYMQGYSKWDDQPYWRVTYIPPER
jgi:hypothetical protein